MTDYSASNYYQTLQRLINAKTGSSPSSDTQMNWDIISEAYYSDLSNIPTPDGYENHVAFWDDTNLTSATGLYWDEDNGKLGIGTASPSTTLDVNGAATISQYMNINGSSTETCYLQIGQGRSDSGYAIIDLVGDATYTDYGLRVIRLNGGANSASYIEHRGTGALLFLTHEAGNIEFNTNSTSAMIIDSSQNVGIGVSPSYRLDVKTDSSNSWAAQIFNDGNNANRYGLIIQCGADDQSSGTHYYFAALDGDGGEEGYLCVANGTFQLIQASSESKKEDIADTKINALEIINNLSVREFRRKTKTVKQKTPLHIGFIAEEVQNIFPDMVVKDPNGDLFISESKLISVLIKGMQELQNEINELKNKNGE